MLLLAYGMVLLAGVVGYVVGYLEAEKEYERNQKRAKYYRNYRGIEYGGGSVGVVQGKRG